MNLALCFTFLALYLDSALSQNLTTIAGRPIGDKTNSLTVGPRGPILLQDVDLIEELANFDRERIPERVVHAKGAGAYGYFQVTKPFIQQWCRAAVFNQIGKKTPVVVRFSTVIGESGSADTLRDPRGFAIKFYTEEGNWDLVGLSTPIFFIRDPFQFPSLIHSFKRHPKSHLKDPNMMWDFLSLRPETLHQVSILFSDQGIPDGFRQMDGHGVHAFRLTNRNNQPVFAKFHLISDQGLKNLDPRVAERLAGLDPDYALRDLFNAIETGNYPSWTMYIQIMTYEQARKWEFNPFDVTKIWPDKDFPPVEVGKLTLTKNPTNNFAEMEQVAFDPANLVPGISPSPDKLLQGRLFSYRDTQRHRLANFFAIPVNRPKCPVMHPTLRDGPAVQDENAGDLPNYFPNSFSNVRQNPAYKNGWDPVEDVRVDQFETKDDDNYSQVTNFWLNVLDAGGRQRLVNNIAESLGMALPFIQERMIKHLNLVHPDLGAGVRAAIQSMQNSKV